MQHYIRAKFEWFLPVNLKDSSNFLALSMRDKMTSQAVCMFTNSEYLENEKSYRETKKP